MVRVFKLRNFDLFLDHNDNYIIYNKHKSFETGHACINNFHTAKYLINVAYKRNMPSDIHSVYLIDCLIRVSTDPAYIEKLHRIRTRLSKHTRTNR